MINSKKKGFTIVELVIVIAVVAILAAVLIPTFSSLVRKANESKDTQLVKNLNTALAADVDGDKTIVSALEAAAEFGYDVAKINASATDNEILWDSKNNVFCYLKDGTVVYIPEFPGAITVENNADYWAIDDEINTTYSTYYYGSNNISSNTSTNICVVTNGNDLTIDAINANVYHYGDVANLTIEAVKSASYHEFGRVTQLAIVKKGHVKVEEGGSIGALVVATSEVKLSGEFGVVMGTSDVLANADIPEGVKKQTVNSVDALDGKVAIVDGTLYDDFSTALNNANGKTVVLVRDVKFAANKVFEIASGTAVTIDLNGHAIMATAAEGEASAVITNNGMLTIKDSVGGGLITTNALNPDMKPSPGFASNTITNNGTLIIEGGTIENTSAGAASYAVDNSSGSIFTMTGGTLSSMFDAVRLYASSSDIVANISGGTINATGSCIWLHTGTKAVNIEINISGGTFNDSVHDKWRAIHLGNSFSNNGTYANTTINITGGTVNGDIYVQNYLNSGAKKVTIENINVSGSIIRDTDENPAN